MSDRNQDGGVGDDFHDNQVGVDSDTGQDRAGRRAIRRVAQSIETALRKRHASRTLRLSAGFPAIGRNTPPAEVCGVAVIVGGYALPLPKDQIHLPLLEHHDGNPAVDLAAPLGTPVFAIVAGKVAYTSPGDACGLGMEIVDASGVRWMYCHMSQRLVPDGSPVAVGTQVALVGSTGESTGPHLHMQVRTPANPLMAAAERCPQPFLTALYLGRQPPAPSELPTKGPCAVGSA